MAGKSKQVSEPANRRGYWQEQIAKANKRWDRFERDGSLVVDRYRLERDNAAYDKYQDRYNILYSSTETTKPSLYAQTPKVQAVKRHPDRENDTATMATLLLETVTQYAMEEIDFDEVVKNAVEDYLLPGMGQVWVRYTPAFKPKVDDAGEVVRDPRTKEPVEEFDFDGLDVDYVYFRDFRTGPGRVWKELPWIAKRTYLSKPNAIKRFSKEKAAKLKYTHNQTDKEQHKEEGDHGGAQAVVWEIWDKDNRKVIWFSEDYPDDVLDEVDDPLKLKDFWPCPRPMRAVSNTRSMIPKSFYSQYKAQAEELDNLTEKIRILTQALRVIGVYDGSNETLQNLFSGQGNKMVKVDNWAQFSGTGGIKGSIDWVPITEVANVLRNLLEQREIVKGEIYEITGFSDIVRGVSKASETLGAQKIKADWAGGRLRSMQAEVERFCRDIIRIMSEIICEQFSEETLAVYAGFELPPVTDQEQQAAAAYTAQSMQPPVPGQPPVQPPPPTMRDQAKKTFSDVVALLKQEKRRCALIGVETDSTIMPDQEKERADRMAFLGAIGAFLQQAGPMALQYPDMRGLLGAIMMFTIRTFRQSRSIEKEFETFQKTLANAPPMPPPGQGGEKADPEAEKAKLAAQQQEAAATLAADQQKAAQADALKRYEIDAKQETERQRLAAEERYKMAELAIRAREVAVKEAELGIKRQEVDTDAELARADMQHRHEQDEITQDRADVEMDTKTDLEHRKLDQAEDAGQGENGD